MREIKFRAWDVEKQQMVTKGYDYHVRLIQADIGEDGYDGAIHQQTTKEAEQYPLMQYTGLKDKNGVEIYEGDICKAFKPNSYLDGNYTVIWDEQHGKWAYDYNSFPNRNYQVGKAGNIQCEVIGNIYENSELLK